MKEILILLCVIIFFVFIIKFNNKYTEVKLLNFISIIIILICILCLVYIVFKVPLTQWLKNLITNAIKKIITIP